MKNKIRAGIVLAIIFAVYNVLAFALPFVHNAVFWLSYVFSMVAIAAQVYIMYTAFMKEEGAKSKFYGFPIAKVGVIYLLIQLALGFVMMIFAARVVTWIPVVLYVVLLGVAAIGFIATDSMRDEVERQDVQMKKVVSVMRDLQGKVSGIVNLSAADMRADIAKLAEDMRYSDPVSNDALAGIESELSANVDALRAAVVAGDSETARRLCRQTSAALAERNRLCKLNKK